MTVASSWDRDSMRLGLTDRRKIPLPRTFVMCQRYRGMYRLWYFVAFIAVTATAFGVLVAFDKFLG
jgi:hypothetical protein